jgi:dihydrolipoamide dehydrogenase
VKLRKIDVIQGTGRLVPGRPALDVDGRVVEATDVVLATGSYARLLPGMEIGRRVITSDQALALDYVPESAVVIGAGAVGLEFASFYRSMGAEVTLVEALPRLAPLEDEEISKELDRAYRRRGIKAFADAKVQDVQEGDESVHVTYEAKGKTETVAADICLVSVGRGPVSDGAGYEEAGIELDRGYVKVDGRLQTTVPHVWAIGDLAATPYQLAHVSFAEGISVAERIAGLDPPEIDYTGVCRVTYCTPEVASVGLTEAQATERGYELEIEKLNMQAIGKANILAEGGMVKLVAQAGGGPVLGVHMIGPHVTDLIAEGMLIVNWEAVPAEVAALIHPHPSLSEALGEAHLALAGKSLHTA